MIKKIDIFEGEQRKIISRVSDLINLPKTGKFRWNKYRGDVTCRIIKKFASTHIPDSMKLVGPNAYINNWPDEFDLLLVNSKAKPLPCTNAYKSNDVYKIIEVKKSGFYNSVEDPKWYLERFNALHNKFDKMNCTYLSISEIANPKKESSKNWVELTRKVLEPKYKCFFLQDSRTKELIKYQWRKFIENLLDI